MIQSQFNKNLQKNQNNCLTQKQYSNKSYFRANIIIKIFFFLITIHSIQFIEITNCKNVQTVQNLHDNNKNLQKIHFNNNRLLEIQRQIQMTQQMINLYKQRLQVLQQLKQQIIQNDQSTQNNKNNNNKQQKNFQNINQQNKINKSKNKQSSTKFIKDLLLVNQYQLKNFGQQDQLERDLKIIDKQQDIILFPPFVINIRQKYVTLINQLTKSKSKITGLPYKINRNFLYQYGKNSNRLLFYSFQEKPSLVLSQSQKSTDFNHKQFILNLALQIKPNKIKNVKIIFKLFQKKTGSKQLNQKLSNQPQESNQYQKFEQNKFFIQQIITSYQSHQLLSKNFKWHKALQFEDLLVGFNGKNILIKSKDKRMHQIDVKTKVKDIYSLNQYKLLFITDKSIGTINVRSLAILDQIKLEYYLGNRTLVEERKKRQSAQNNDQQNQNNQQQDCYKLDSQEQNIQSFWHHPVKTKCFTKKITILSSYHMQNTKQTLILLSNADLLLYQKDRIVSNINFGSQLSRKFLIDPSLFQKANQQFMKIQIQLIEPTFNHMLIYSNKHQKIVIFNITIPNLSLVKGSGGWFSSDYKLSNQFKGQYWQTLQFESQQSLQLNEKRFYTFATKKQILIQLNHNQKYLSNYYLESKIQNNKNSQVNVAIIFFLSHQNQSLKIQEYRLMVDIFGGRNGISSMWGLNKNEGSNQFKTQGKSYWWNIFMVGMIILGVLIFRKCRQATSQSDNENNPNQIDNINSFLGKNKGTKNSSLNRLKPKADEQKINNKGKKPLLANQSILTQLQSYLQKQGQKLPRQQLIQLAQQLQRQQEQQYIMNQSKSKETKPIVKKNNKMRRQQDQIEENDDDKINAINEQLQLKANNNPNKKKRD